MAAPFFGGPASFGPLGNAGPATSHAAFENSFSTGAFGPGAGSGLDWKTVAIIGVTAVGITWIITHALNS